LGADLEYQTGDEADKIMSLQICPYFVIYHSLKFFERGLGKTFFQKSFPQL
jgi:hypothetical protein